MTRTFGRWRLGETALNNLRNPQPADLRVPPRSSGFSAILWEITHNPWVVLQMVSRDQIEARLGGFLDNGATELNKDV